MSHPRTAPCLLLLFVCGCSNGTTESTAATAAIPVAVTPAAARQVQRTVEVLGTLHGDQEATISNEVTGVVKHIHADVGDLVSSTALLAELDPDDYQRAVSVARWSLQQSLARLGTSKVPGDDFDVESAATVVRAQAQLANARAKLARLQGLKASITAQDVKDAETTVTVSVANVDVERLATRALVAEARKRQAELETAQHRLVQARLVTPGGERTWAVAERLVSKGEYLREGTPAFRVVACDPLELRTMVPERYAPRIRVDQPVQVRVEAFGERLFSGRVTRINPTVDPTSRTFGIRVRVPNPSGELRPGTFARASIRTHTERAVLVPLEAVVSVAGINKLFVLEGSLAKELLVEIGARHDDLVEVSPIPPNAKVITSGQTVVTNGAQVELTAKAVE